MKLSKIRISEKEVMPFTIPSGIVTTSTKCLERIANEIPELGVLTTKSIGPVPREGYREPILHQYAPGCFENAVGLTNPGADAFAEELSRIHIPKNKVLIGSIFGANIEEFVYVARRLEPYVDAFELNVSCPHVKGHGMQLGQDPDFVLKLTHRLKRAMQKPVFVKLPPIPGIIESAEAAVAGGAGGLVMINTERGYSYILTNGNCGLSGRGIKPLGVRCVRDVRQAVGDKVLIIGMGGITTAQDIVDYANAGANAFGIGSALAGMKDSEIKNYFNLLRRDLEDETALTRILTKEIDMIYKIVGIQEVVNAGCDFKVYRTDKEIRAEPGQFVFARIPSVGEKPFSIMDDNPLTLGILEKGEFTRKFNSLRVGDCFYLRGPYGKGVDICSGSNVVLVGGGCGIAGLYLLAKKLSRKASILSLFGARDREHIPYLGEFRKYGDVRIATEDGSLGRKGMVSDLFAEANLKEGSYFFNCGPRAMAEVVLPLESQLTSPERICSSVDYMTRCGVGICGSCADEKGRRTCIEGPFMNLVR